jgi:VanZ family protein
MAFDAAIRRLVSFSERHAFAGLLVSLVAFFGATVIPLGSLNPFARTDVRVDDAGRIIVDRPSLYASEINPLALSGDAMRRGAFVIRATIAVGHPSARGPARILAFSEGPRLQNWLLGQEGRALHVRFLGRVAEFDDVFEGRETTVAVAFGPDEITLVQDGGERRTTPLSGTAHPWSDRCRFVFGNEVTGDRPWSGTIRDVTIRSLDAGSPVLFALDPAPPDRLTLVAEDLDSDPSEPSISLERVDWPWHYKLQKYREHGGAYDHVTNGDRIRNVILTIPLGFFFALCLRRRRIGPTLAIALAGGAVVSAIAETHQFLAPARVASVGDVILNALGSGIGALSGITARLRPR